MTTVEVLREGRARIALPENWTKGSYRTPDGRCCMSGAIGMPSSDGAGVYGAYAVLQEAIGLPLTISLSTWNDVPERTHAEVLAAFDHAIEIAEARA